MMDFREWVKDKDLDFSALENMGDRKEVFEDYLDTLDNAQDLDWLIEQTEAARELMPLPGFRGIEFSLWLMERARQFIFNKGHHKKG